MEQKIERVKMLALFERDMRINEKSQATIEKYLRDVKGFIRYVGEDGMITKNVVIAEMVCSHKRQFHAGGGELFSQGSGK